MDRNKYLSYDAARAFLYEREESQGQYLLYRHDALGRLSTISRRLNGIETELVRYGYTADGRLAYRSQTTLAEELYLISDGDHVIIERTATATQRTYIWAGATLLKSRATGGVELHLYQDRLGSVVLATKRGSGSTSMHGRAQYDPYGNNISNSTWDGDGVGQPYGYTGARWDSLAGLYLMGARWYAPEMGRFVELDPIGEGGGWNLYNYVGSSPTMWVDPSGLRAQMAGSFSVPGQSGSQMGSTAVYMDGVRVENGGSWMAFAANHQQTATDAGLRAEDQQNAVGAAVWALGKAVEALQAATGNGADPSTTAGLAQDVADATTRLTSLAGAAADTLSDGQVSTVTDALGAAGEALQDYQSASGSGPKVLTVFNDTASMKQGAPTGRDMLVALDRLNVHANPKGYVATPSNTLQERDVAGGNKAIRLTTYADRWLSVRGTIDRLGKAGDFGGPFAEVYVDRVRSELAKAADYTNTAADLGGFGVVGAAARLGTAIGNAAGHEFGHLFYNAEDPRGKHPEGTGAADANGVFDPFRVATNLMDYQNGLSLVSTIPRLPR